MLGLFSIVKYFILTINYWKFLSPTNLTNFFFPFLNYSYSFSLSKNPIDYDEVFLNLPSAAS